jgi:hypothetical protein
MCLRLFNVYGLRHNLRDYLRLRCRCRFNDNLRLNDRSRCLNGRCLIDSRRLDVFSI